MADFVDDVAVYLAAQGIGNATGASVNIFAGKYPDDPDNIVAVLGLEGGQLPNSTIPDLIFPRFQILVRNTDYDTGAAKLKAVRDALHVKIGISTTNFKVLRCHCQQEGAPIGQDEKDRYEWSINFYAEARPLVGGI